MLNVVADQFGAPTGAELIANVTALIAHRIMIGPTPTLRLGPIIWLPQVKRHDMTLLASFCNMPSVMMWF